MPTFNTKCRTVEQPSLVTDHVQNPQQFRPILPTRMLRRSCLVFFFSAIIYTGSLSAQPQAATPIRDSAAIALLNQVIAVAGGTQAIGTIRDFTGSGSITYSWSKAGSSSATVHGLNGSFFRLDAQLPEGIRSWVVTDLGGTLRRSDGSKTSINYANAQSLRYLTFPYPLIALALADPSTAITISGTSTVSGREEIRVEISPASVSPAPANSESPVVGSTTYVIDPQSSLVLEAENASWSEDGRMSSAVHDVIFSEYKTVAGVLAPFQVTEFVGNQLTWTLHLDTLNLNTGLVSGDFVL